MKMLWLLTLCLCSGQLLAKKFSHQLLEFELPPGWDCQLDIADWACRSQNKNQQQEAVIIISTKVRDIDDSLEQYRNYLKTTRSYRLGKEKSYSSQPKYVQNRRIRNHLWIEALQLSSEVPGFYTRYMATVKGETGIAVTFTVARNKYHHYKGLFDQMIASFKFFPRATTNLPLLNLVSSQNLPGLNDIFPPAESGLATSPPPADQKNSFWWLILLLVCSGAGVAIYRSKRRQNKSPPPSHSPEEDERFSA